MELQLSAVKAGSSLFSSSKSVHAPCFEAILIANNYTPGSSKGNICVLHTPRSNHKHSVSMVTTPPTVNKTITRNTHAQSMHRAEEYPEIWINICCNHM